MILLTDGWGQQGRMDELVEELSEAGVTLSVVAAGAGSDANLANLAELGGGRYYPATDILRVPDFFLKETVTAVGHYLVEEPFYLLRFASSPILRGLDSELLPVLRGYNGTTAKPLARTVLTTPRGDPLLATWQYGLGRTAAWTSDLTGRWAANWIEWEAYTRFANQLAGWTLAPPQVEGFVAQTKLEEGQAVITVNTTNAARTDLELSATLIGPGLEAVEMAFAQVGVDQYVAQAEASQSGIYLIQLQIEENNQPIGQQTLGLAVPYSPEYGVQTTNRGLLSQLASRTGGGELVEPMAAFLHNLPISEQVREIWQWLLLASALLFPLDIAIRRVLFGQISPQRVGAALQERTQNSPLATWLRDRMPRRAEPAESQPKLLGSLHNARKRRQRARTSPLVESTSSPRSASKAMSDVTTSATSTEPQPDETTDQDTLSRLRQAKRRARR